MNLETKNYLQDDKDRKEGRETMKNRLENCYVVVFQFACGINLVKTRRCRSLTTINIRKLLNYFIHIPPTQIDLSILGTNSM